MIERLGCVQAQAAGDGMSVTGLNEAIHMRLRVLNEQHPLVRLPVRQDQQPGLPNGLLAQQNQLDYRRSLVKPGEIVQGMKLEALTDAQGGLNATPAELLRPSHHERSHTSDAAEVRYTAVLSHAKEYKDEPNFIPSRNKPYLVPIAHCVFNSHGDVEDYRDHQWLHFDEQEKKYVALDNSPSARQALVAVLFAPDKIRMMHASDSSLGYGVKIYLKHQMGGIQLHFKTYTDKWDFVIVMEQETGLFAVDAT